MIYNMVYSTTDKSDKFNISGLFDSKCIDARTLFFKECTEALQVYINLLKEEVPKVKDLLLKSYLKTSILNIESRLERLTLVKDEFLQNDSVKIENYELLCITEYQIRHKGVDY